VAGRGRGAGGVRRVVELRPRVGAADPGAAVDARRAPRARRRGCCAARSRRARGRGGDALAAAASAGDRRAAAGLPAHCRRRQRASSASALGRARSGARRGRVARGARARDAVRGARAGTPRRTWTVAPGVLRWRDAESPSSLATFLGCSFKWVVSYQGGVWPGTTAALPATERLLGT